MICSVFHIILAHWSNKWKISINFTTQHESCSTGQIYDISFIYPIVGGCESDDWAYEESGCNICRLLPPAPILKPAVPVPPFWPFFCLWLSELRLCSWVSWKTNGIHELTHSFHDPNYTQWLRFTVLRDHRPCSCHAGIKISPAVHRGARRVHTAVWLIVQSPKAAHWKRSKCNSR